MFGILLCMNARSFCLIYISSGKIVIGIRSLTNQAASFKVSSVPSSQVANIVFYFCTDSNTDSNTDSILQQFVAYASFFTHHIVPSFMIYLWLHSTELQKIFSFLGNREIIFCEMKVLFTTAYIQYTISLQLYLLKRYLAEVTERGFQAIKVAGDVEKLVMVFRKVCRRLKVLHLIHSKEH